MSCMLRGTVSTQGWFNLDFPPCPQLGLLTNRGSLLLLWCLRHIHPVPGADCKIGLWGVIFPSAAAVILVEREPEVAVPLRSHPGSAAQRRAAAGPLPPGPRCCSSQRFTDEINHI